jgi:transcription elongation GreA/GreB family factor
MLDAQDAANEEMKSSAGDKYNTDRALMHIERDNHAKQLVEAQLLLKTLDGISIEKSSEQANLGSLVETTSGNYFLSISSGKISIDGYEAIALSTASPIGQQLLGKKAGDQFEFNSKTNTIIAVK